MALQPVLRAANYTMTIQQGSNLYLLLTLVDSTETAYNISDVTSVDAKIRDNFGATSSVIQTLTAAVTDAANGKVLVSLTAAQTAALDVPAGTDDDVRSARIGYWDIEFTNSAGDIYRYLEGEAFLSREVTK